MSTVRKLHDKAMVLAQRAIVARHENNFQEAEQLAREAFVYEMEAADLVPDKKESEPTRSILYKSAASLAYQCKELATAQRLIAKGLSGYPPPKIEKELKDLYEQVNFERHLETRGEKLQTTDLQMSMTGESVGFGMILFDDFNKRIKPVTQLLNRTSQRLIGSPYQSTGRVPEKHKPFTQALSAMPPSSFVVKISLVVPMGGQTQMLINPEDVIDEVLTGIDLINNSKDKELERLINDESYYLNFVSLAKEIAPDGKKVKLVGLTTQKRQIGFVRTNSSIEIEKEEQIVMPERVVRRTLEKLTVRGVLDFASLRNQEVVGITTDEKQTYSILVKEGLDDLVKAYLRQWVTVTGWYDGKFISLSSIQTTD